MVDVTTSNARLVDDAAAVLGAVSDKLMVGAGPTTRVDRSVVRVSTSVMEEPEGRFSLTVDPFGSVSNST